MEWTLKDIEAMVDRLGPVDRVRLLQQLIPRLADAVREAGSTPGPMANGGAHAWAEFRRVGERLAARANGTPLTRAIGDMRR